MEIKVSALYKNIEKFESHDSSVRESGYEELSNKVSADTFSNAEKMDLLRLLSSEEFLFFRINEGESDDSVRRSFSILGITLLLSSDSNLDLAWLMPKILDYVEREKDFRGKDDSIGWIHSLAHLGDFLANLSYNKSIPLEEKMNFINCLLRKVRSVGKSPLIFGEDIRIAKAIAYFIEDNANCDFDCLLNYLELGTNNEIPYNFNTLNIVRALYIEFSKQKKNTFLEKIENRLLV